MIHDNTSTHVLYSSSHINFANLLVWVLETVYRMMYYNCKYFLMQLHCIIQAPEMF